MKENKRILLAIFGCLLLIMIVAEMNYIHLCIKSNRVFHQGATVDAVVSEIELSSGRGKPQHILYVDYEVDGETYTHVNYGVDLTYKMHVGDSCVAYYDIKNPNFAISKHSVKQYSRSAEIMGCMILFATASAWFTWYIKKGEPTKTR